VGAQAVLTLAVDVEQPVTDERDEPFEELIVGLAAW
jgi:hypothetical protein